MNNTLKIKKLNELAVIPFKGSIDAAGYDLSSIEEYTLMPMERKLFKTGLSFSIPNGMYGRIAPRSGLASKDGIDVLAGVCDNDFRGDIGVLLINLGKNEKQIKVGDKIAQIIFEFYNEVNIEVVDELPETIRGENGYGSTDNNKKKVITESSPSSKISFPKEATSLINKWKETVISEEVHQKYESAVKEREKQIS